VFAGPPPASTEKFHCHELGAMPRGDLPLFGDVEAPVIPGETSSERVLLAVIAKRRRI